MDMRTRSLHSHASGKRSGGTVSLSSSASQINSARSRRSAFLPLAFENAGVFSRGEEVEIEVSRVNSSVRVHILVARVHMVGKAVVAANERIGERVAGGRVSENHI